MEIRPLHLNDKEKKIEKIINEYIGKKTLSCDKISNDNNDNENISKATVHRILTKKLNLHFRKTKIKTNKLLNKESILQTFLY